MGREGVVSRDGGWAGKGTVGREGDGIEGGEHRGSSGQLGGWWRGWVLCRIGRW